MLYFLKVLKDQPPVKINAPSIKAAWFAHYYKGVKLRKVEKISETEFMVTLPHNFDNVEHYNNYVKNNK